MDVTAIFLLHVYFSDYLVWISLCITAHHLHFRAKELKQNNVTRATNNFGSRKVLVTSGAIFFWHCCISVSSCRVSDSMIRGQERSLSLLSDISSALGDTFVIVKNGKDVATLLLTNVNVTTREMQAGSPASAIEQLRISVVSVSGTLGTCTAAACNTSSATVHFHFIPLATSYREKALDDTGRTCANTCLY